MKILFLIFNIISFTKSSANQFAPFQPVSAYNSNNSSVILSRLLTRALFPLDGLRASHLI